MKTAVADRLNVRQRLFVTEYLVDQKGGPAAVRAGYSAKAADQIASRLLRHAQVAAAIDAALAIRAQKTETDAEWVIRRLKEEADRTGEGTSHSARVRALELIGRHNGLLDPDNGPPPAAANVTVNVGVAVASQAVNLTALTDDQVRHLAELLGTAVAPPVAALPPAGDPPPAGR